MRGQIINPKTQITACSKASTKLVVMAFLYAALAGCSSKDPLAGPIPECEELLSIERNDYVRFANESCDQARSFEEKMKSPGCGIKNKWLLCRSIKSSMQPIKVKPD